MTIKHRLLIAVLALLVPAAALAGPATVFLGGAVYTLNDKQPWVSALVVQDGRIAYVGADPGARRFIDKKARFTFAPEESVPAVRKAGDDQS